jgi:putative transposase
MDLYHALNRGVDRRILFEDSQDYARFVHDMFEFNTPAPAKNVARNRMSDLRSRSSLYQASEGGDIFGPRLVDIHGWCLMHNHYHLLLSERVEGGVVLFLRKLNIGYAKYFNERYKRSGTLFQGRTKKILIDNDAHFLHILNYIHLNPLDTLKGARQWRNREIDNFAEARKVLKEYRWSSYLDYAGEKNFPSILTTSLFQDVFGANYTHELNQYLKDLEINEVEHLLLEKE